MLHSNMGPHPALQNAEHLARMYLVVCYKGAYTFRTTAFSTEAFSFSEQSSLLCAGCVRTPAQMALNRRLGGCVGASSVKSAVLGDVGPLHTRKSLLGVKGVPTPINAQVFICCYRYSFTVQRRFFIMRVPRMRAASQFWGFSRRSIARKRNHYRFYRFTHPRFVTSRRCNWIGGVYFSPQPTNPIPKEVVWLLHYIESGVQ